MKDEINDELDKEMKRYLFCEIDDTEKEKAVRYLMDNVPIDCLEKIWSAIQKKGDSWSWRLHLGLGIYIRNILRTGGFDWGSNILDALWASLIEEACERKIHESVRWKTINKMLKVWKDRKKNDIFKW